MHGLRSYSRKLRFSHSINAPSSVLSHPQQDRTSLLFVSDAVFPAHPCRISSSEALRGLLMKTYWCYVQEWTIEESIASKLVVDEVRSRLTRREFVGKLACANGVNSERSGVYHLWLGMG